MNRRPIRTRSFIVAILGVAIAVGFGASLDGRAAASPSLAGPIGKSFRPEAAPPGMVSQETAIINALHFANATAGNHLPANISAQAYFGIYTDTLIHDRPVWIVRLSGPGIGFTGTGGPAPLPGTPYCESPVTHSVIVVIDGKTGKFLEATVGYEPDGVPTIVTTPEPVPTPCAARPAHAISPASVAVGARGNLFIGGLGSSPRWFPTDEIQKRAPSGAFLFSWRTSRPGTQPHGINRIAVDRKGDIYVANGVALIQKFSPAGHPLWAWMPKGRRPGQPSSWWNVAVSPQGVAYAAARDAGIYVLSASGKLRGHWPGKWDSLAVADDGTVYAANVARGEVQSFTLSGRMRRRWLIQTSPGTGSIISIAAGHDRSGYVLELRTKIVQPFYEVARYAPTGKLAGSFRIGADVSVGGLVDPRDLAVGPRGAIFIADYGNPRINLYTPEGTYRGGWEL